jgi:4-amino-4-deoxy-L-arabinose transferase-like glycosyltransferase
MKTMPQKLSLRNLPVPLVAVGALAVVARVLAMVFFPLTDKTEARYGEIARKMSETNDWITPWYDYGVPFWAKPPMSTWFSAASMDVFGVNAFAARFPSLLIGLALLPLMYIFARRDERPLRLAACLMLLTMGMYYVAIGTVMTDMTLVLACTLAMVGFWFGVEEGSKRWGYVFFAGLGLGLLAKGPVAIVLCGIPLFFWVLWTNSWMKMFKSLPFVTGTLLMCAIGLPWYYLAEQKTPGFLEYFIVGEHFKRFTVPGWTGDRYGHAHEAPLGMIWPYLLADGLPWSLLLLGVFGIRLARKQKVLHSPLDNQTKFLLCWLIMPNFFFTFAHNIIETYPLVSLPALAVLAAREMAPVAIGGEAIRKWVYASAALLPALVVIGLIGLGVRPDLLKNTAVHVGAVFTQEDPDMDGKLVYVGDRIYSMEFYTSGKTSHYPSIQEAVAAAQKMHEPVLALTAKQSETIPADVAPHLKLVAKADPKYLIYEVEK